MGDALAVVLIHGRRFSQKDFQRFHPGGSLGERLSTKIREVMFTGDHIPVVVLGTKVREAAREIEAKGIGATLVVDEDCRLKGIMTDGDLRRAFTKHPHIQDLKVEEIMSPSPRTIDQEQTAAEALGIMELYGITHLCIVDREERVLGAVHLHDLLGREDFKVNDSLKLSSWAHRRSDHTP
jgi:arabinose-5-phosphate isomerase